MSQPIDAGEVLGFEATAAGAGAADVLDLERCPGESCQAQRVAEELAAAFEGAAVELG